MSNSFSGTLYSSRGKQSGMPVTSLYDSRGGRKYLLARERRSFAEVALRAAPPIMTFGLTLLYTGARISEVLQLSPERIDRAENAIIFETLKRRQRGIFRAVPAPPQIISCLAQFVDRGSREPSRVGHQSRVWTWGRTTAWKYVKSIMEVANIPERLRTPRALRHAFAVNAIQSGIALNVLQRWMGHARIETTAIYADVMGDEERALAQRTWSTLSDLMPPIVVFGSADGINPRVESRNLTDNCHHAQSPRRPCRH